MSGSFGTWLVAMQSLFGREITAALKASITTGAMPFTLIGLSAAYGVLHAAGPGHGKAVISAYLFATGDTLKKGLMLSTASALLQAVVAIAMVATLGLVLGVTARSMDAVSLILERFSYAAIAAMGLWLMWRKGKSLWAMLRSPDAAPHMHGPDCGHVLMPERNASPSAAFGAIVAGGLRPCTGALLVLVFALAHGAFLLGIAATVAMALGTAVTVAAIATLAVSAKGLAVRLARPDRRSAVLVLRCIEVVAGVAIFVLGASLAIGVSAAALS
jgi:nickel/cobalt exporter